MENGRASGIDGLPAEFYKAFWAVIGQDVLDVLQDSIQRGELPLSCRRAVLTLLPKKGDLTHLKNWHPVSLLCTDCKLLSKALASRLTKVMEQLIHQDQTYCLPDRSIFDNVYLVRHILDVSRLLGLKTGLIFLDQEKAFDRVEHEYLWKVLETFGFQPSIQALLVDFFWDGLHWISQSVLHLPKEEGGQGLVQLASRTAAFCLQFLQRLLTGPKDLIWRPVAHGLLHKGYGTLHWLMEEPLIHGGRLDISGVTVPALYRALISSRVVTLRELVNIAGTDLSRAEDLAARLGLRSLRVVNQLLRH
ncbi:hypothetical protein QTP86_024538 [Hemibagrus guttatus]|nr:hypothetical protein QTP86_024538 [Hemibagrus guttatus]